MSISALESRELWHITVDILPDYRLIGLVEANGKRRTISYTPGCYRKRMSLDHEAVALRVDHGAARVDE